MAQFIVEKLEEGVSSLIAVLSDSPDCHVLTETSSMVGH